LGRPQSVPGRLVGRIQNLLNVSAPAPSCAWDGWDGLKPYIPPAFTWLLVMADRLFRYSRRMLQLHFGHPSNVACCTLHVACCVLHFAPCGPVVPWSLRLRVACCTLHASGTLAVRLAASKTSVNQPLARLYACFYPRAPRNSPCLTLICSTAAYCRFGRLATSACFRLLPAGQPENGSKRK
jgi:hypothetical protein